MAEIMIFPTPEKTPTYTKPEVRVHDTGPRPLFSRIVFCVMYAAILIVVIAAVIDAFRIALQ